MAGEEHSTWTWSFGSSYMSLIPNGLNDREHPNYGGWGGRYELYTPKFEDTDWRPTGKIRSSLNLRPGRYGRMRRTATHRRRTGDSLTLLERTSRSTNRRRSQSGAGETKCKTTRDCNHPPVPVFGHRERVHCAQWGAVLLRCHRFTRSGPRFNARRREITWKPLIYSHSRKI